LAPKIKILHVISGLDIGGAEMMLYKLLHQMDRGAFDSSVLSLRAPGQLGKRIERIGIPVETLGLSNRKFPTPRDLVNLKRVVDKCAPQIIQGWMYHGNLGAYLGCKLSSKKPTLMWNIRQTLQSIVNEKWGTRKVIKIGGRLSSRPHKIVFNSNVSIEDHCRVGYSKDKAVMIPNGFQRQPRNFGRMHRDRARQELGFRADQIVFGCVGRYHPKKDQLGFIRASARVAKKISDAQFFLVGRDVCEQNHNLVSEIDRLGLREHCRLLGEKEDIFAVMAAADFVVSSSAWGEGFPNTIGEAMSIGIPCIVTDVGESRELVGEAGIVVRPKNVDELAQRMIAASELAPEGRNEMGEDAQLRIEKVFSIETITETYANLYNSIHTDI
jgi:glycosyltransferase involved in cell wall biosynthesis